MALSAAALCTLASVKDLLGITVATYDSLLESLIEAASAWMANECERVFQADDYANELYDGDGTDDFFPEKYPVNSVSELKISGTEIDASADYDDTGYFLYNRPQNAPSRIHYQEGFTVGRQNIDISYNAGYSTIPFDLAQACRNLVIFKWQNRDKPGGVNSERIGNYSYTIKDAETAGIVPVLSLYKRKWAI